MGKNPRIAQTRIAPWAILEIILHPKHMLRFRTTPMKHDRKPKILYISNNISIILWFLK